MRHLLAEKELTFKKAYELAIAQETAEKNTAELKQKEAINEYAWQPRRRVRIHQSQKQPVHQSQKQPVHQSQKHEYSKQVTERLTRYPVVVNAVGNRDTNSSSAG